MTIWRLVIKEIRYRKVNFTLSVLSVLVAVGFLVASITLLRVHNRRTEQIVQAKIAETAEAVRRRQRDADTRAAELTEAFRKIMLKFGYNLLILPKTEKIIDYQVRGAAATYMPEDNVRILSESGIMTVRHLLPILQQRQVLIFGNRRQEVFLVGTRGEIPLSHREPKQPLLSAVRAGEIIVGHGIHRELGVDVGDTVRLIDREFKVSRWYAPRGTNDDSTVWIELGQAQQMLGKPGKINGILALSCVCTQ
ncbi:unnamed protein product, partial [marine sediment metagenome]